MSVRDIIEAATAGPWTLGKGSMTIREDSEKMRFIARVHIAGEMRRFTSEQQNANARFIAEFNPEHQSLIEAVVEAANHIDCVAIPYNAGQGDAYYSNAADMHRLHDARMALTAYRRERGLL